MENPVASRTISAFARLIGPPATAVNFSVSTRFVPETRASTGCSPARNTSDLPIWPSTLFTAAAASSAVRVLSANWVISTWMPSCSSASATRCTDAFMYFLLRHVFRYVFDERQWCAACHFCWNHQAILPSRAGDATLLEICVRESEIGDCN